MPDSTLSEALKEAYASAPSDVILLHTLELRHPTFVDDHGNSTAIRVVRDHINHTCTLENSAPLNHGEAVEFIAMAFDLELPPVNNTPTRPFVYLKHRNMVSGRWPNYFVTISNSMA